MKTVTNIFTQRCALFAFACFALLATPNARVVPAPDGGYPGGNSPLKARTHSSSVDTSQGVANTAVGFQTLFNLTTGIDNTAIGWEALFTTTTGSLNTALGNGALQVNTTGV